MCQCPQRASIHFYDESRRWLYNEGCVNALNGLLSISTIESTGYFKTAWGVSMPSTGFYPFLPYYFFYCAEHMLCQCPQRASIHFYKLTDEQLQRIANCVNALNGLLSISTVRSLRDISIILSVSMPSTGFYPFLQVYDMLGIYRTKMCQCPQRASIHFYQF